MDHPDALFVEREDYPGSSVVFMSTTYFQNVPVTLINNVRDFEVKDKYMFATRNEVRRQKGT